MRTGIGAVLLVGAAVLATGPAATATATWTIRPGGTITATASQAVLTDTTTGTTLGCSGASMSGTLKGGSGLPGRGIGSITTAVFHCAGPTGWPTLTSRGLPWHLNLVSYNAGTGVSRGTISHLMLALTDPPAARWSMAPAALHPTGWWRSRTPLQPAS